MRTDPAQQSANRIASRSELSSNWRANVETPSAGGSDAATRTLGPSSKPDYLQRHAFRSRSSDKENKVDLLVSGETLRGEDDPDTLPAIAEGRRLYVGNMPYIAKTKDVEMLFAESGYHV